MMRPRLHGLLPAIVVVAGLLGGDPAEARRVALVVGNGAYQSLPALPNAEPDARLIASTLGKLGFDTELVLAADKERLTGALQSFSTRASGAEVALVYYSGHGVQTGGANYLLPVSAQLERTADLKANAVDLDTLLSAIHGGKPNYSIVVLDACRDNPLASADAEQGATRSITPNVGIGSAQPAKGMLIAYATRPGQVAFDGPAGGNSPYAASLARYLNEPGLEIGLLFRKVRQRVTEITAGRQVPREDSELPPEPLFLHPPAPVTTEPPQVALNRALDTADAAERALVLARIETAKTDAGLAEVAADQRFRLSATEAERRRRAQVNPDVALAHRERLRQLQGTRAEGLALRSFLALHGNAPEASALRARLAQAERQTAPPPANAATLLWPIVELAAEPELLRRFVELFPQADETASARARLALAELPPPPVGPVLPPIGGPSPPPVTTAFVGTGPLPLRVPNATSELTLIEPPRYGRLLVAAERGVRPTTGQPVIGAGPVRADGLAYEPLIEAREVVDTIVLASNAPDAEREVRLQVLVDVHDCDRLGGARYDPQGVVIGRFPNEARPDEILPACREAVAAFSDTARFRFQLARGLDIAADSAAAAPLYEEAAAKGHVMALYGLGYLYELGKGVPQDLPRAIELYRAGAARDDPYAMNNLGRAYRDGRGVPKDREQAIRWFRKAASRGNTYAYNNLGSMLAAEKNYAEALTLFRASAATGDVYGLNNLALAHENGWGTPRNLQEALRLYEEAAVGGQPHAPINLGLIHRDGRPGLKPDQTAAARWFAEAARIGLPWGHVHLAALYRDGRLGKSDPATAARLLARAAKLDKVEAGTAARKAFDSLPKSAGITAVQELLRAQGFDPGSTSGKLDQPTRNAIQAWAKSRNLQLRADSPLIEILGTLQEPVA